MFLFLFRGLFWVKNKRAKRILRIIAPIGAAELLVVQNRDVKITGF